MKLTDYKGILVYIEYENKNICQISLELLQEARILADIFYDDVIAVVLGYNIKDIADQCIYYGADIVWYADDILLEEYLTERYTDALEFLVKKIGPSSLLIGSSYQGRDFAPRLAIRLGTGLTADCTELGVKFLGDGIVDPNRGILMTRPTYGGNLIATIVCENHRPQMATVRSSMKVIKDITREGLVKEFFPLLKKSRVKILETIIEKTTEKIISEESVLVVGGNGVGSESMFKELYSLAKILNGGVGVTRTLVEKKWVDHSRQIGQTGTTVRPELYISFGVLGAIQHITGMENSNFIISINKDRNAPVFKFSHVGIVGSVEKILPRLIDRLSK